MLAGVWAILFSAVDDAFVKVGEGKFSVGVGMLVAILVLSNSADLLGCRAIVLDVTLLESSSFVDWTTLDFVVVDSIIWTDELVSMFNVDVE